LWWNSEKNLFEMIDQRLLPGDYKVNSYTEHRAVAQAITDMVVRGAPAIGAAAGFGLALAARESNAAEPTNLKSDLTQAAEVLGAARPTAVNLGWALNRILSNIADLDEDAATLRQAVLTEAQKIADEDVEINERMATHGAALVNNGDTIIHHCNTGALATVDWGTALGVIRKAHELGKEIHVLVDETRPRLQGARLTAWELERYGVSYDIISDNAAGFFLSSDQVQRVFVGSDRTAANGDVANKIGTYMLALAARDNDVPFFPVVPTSTIDLELAHGDLIPIEEREQAEVLDLLARGRITHPQGATARNPAFDVTPHRLVTGIVTENGVAYPPFIDTLARSVSGKAP
jgi:methylthioribose-1-phosphate isomerase